jgi:hypothetical protein
MHRARKYLYLKGEDRNRILSALLRGNSNLDSRGCAKEVCRCTCAVKIEVPHLTREEARLKCLDLQIVVMTIKIKTLPLALFSIKKKNHIARSAGFTMSPTAGPDPPSPGGET